jgi:hypothetical protein
MAKKKPARNQRKAKSHLERYGMSKSKWAEFKKTATTQEIESIKLKARSLLK